MFKTEILESIFKYFKYFYLYSNTQCFTQHCNIKMSVCGAACFFQLFTKKTNLIFLLKQSMNSLICFFAFFSPVLISFLCASTFLLRLQHVLPGGTRGAAAQGERAWRVFPHPVQHAETQHKQQACKNRGDRSFIESGNT